MAAHAGFFDLPVELRLDIYDTFLAAHTRIRANVQPSNAHLRLLHASRQFREEAGPILRRYVSLLHEHQILAFRQHAPPSLCEQIQWADVANDGRAYEWSSSECLPLSTLHIVLGRMTALSRLRVFQCRQGLPLNLESPVGLQGVKLRFERAMFPQTAPALRAYELHLGPETRVELFDALRPPALTTLRLSGEIIAAPTAGPARTPAPAPAPALRTLTLHGVTGSFFDRHTVEECFPAARLTAFAYALAHRLGFELRNYHLESLAAAHGAHLRRLVLLGCSRLSSAVLERCLAGMPVLEYFALNLLTVDELRSNFVRALPPRLAVLKLQVINAWYAVPLLEEERGLCDAIESGVLLRERPYEQRIAKDRRVRLEIGPWESRLMDEL